VIEHKPWAHTYFYLDLWVIIHLLIYIFFFSSAFEQNRLQHYHSIFFHCNIFIELVFRCYLLLLCLYYTLVKPIMSVQTCCWNREKTIFVVSFSFPLLYLKIRSLRFILTLFFLVLHICSLYSSFNFSGTLHSQCTIVMDLDHFPFVRSSGIVYTMMALRLLIFFYLDHPLYSSILVCIYTLVVYEIN
jgi:hypothetical protein